MGEPAGTAGICAGLYNGFDPKSGIRRPMFGIAYVFRLTHVDNGCLSSYCGVCCRSVLLEVAFRIRSTFVESDRMLT